MTTLSDVTSAINYINDRVRSIIERGVKLEINLTDFQILYKFHFRFDLNDFRKFISLYRNTNGKKNLNEELLLILKAIDSYSRFFSLNKNKLSQIDSIKLIYLAAKVYKDEVEVAYEEVKTASKLLDDVRAEIESKSWKMESEDSEYKELRIKEKEFKQELKEAKEIYESKHKDHHNQIVLNSKIATFSQVYDDLKNIKDLIETDYIDIKKLFPKDFSDDFVILFNTIFKPELNQKEIKHFLNTIRSPKKPILLNKKIKCFFFIYTLSETIIDKDERDKWESAVLTYFNIPRVYYVKKRTDYEETAFEDELEKVL